jgi:ubiquinone/menaquinone biosynthesis C-methylase UbiE
MELKKQKWDESYSRHENSIFYPKEEVVKFLNRFIRKKVGTESFQDLIVTGDKLRALDLGCGIGRQTILFEEFGIEGYGLDISSVALEEAKELSRTMGYAMNSRFKILNKIEIPFEDNYFDFGISDSVLDSMDFSFAKTYLKELDRVVKNYVYISLISSHNTEEGAIFSGDVLVNEKHEQGTIQSYYTPSKIDELINDTEFEIVHLSINIEKNLLNKNEHGRYHVVLKK